VCAEETGWDSEGAGHPFDAGDAASILDLCTYASQDKVGGAEIGGDVLSGAYGNSALAAQIVYVDVDIHGSRSPRRLALKFGDTVVVCDMATE
jgi:hypothetical protein